MKAIFSDRSRSHRSAPRPVLHALLVLVSISASATAQSGVPAIASAEPGATAVADNLAAAVLPVPPAAKPFTGDASLLAGTHKGRGRGKDVVIDVTQTPHGIAFALAGAASRPLPWVEGWTFRENQGLLTFRRSASAGPATELRYDSGGDHFILKRQ